MLSLSFWRKEEPVYSKKDREIVLSIREIFSKNGETPEYREEFNLIRVPIEGDYDIHPLLIKCSGSVLSIFSASFACFPKGLKISILTYDTITIAIIP